MWKILREEVFMKNSNRKGYQIDDAELQKIQEIQKELIAEVDRICKKCGIHYNMVGGTMLGAIRHGDYIPWDDDADIGFLRREYEKFRKACKTELDTDRFYMQDLRDTEGYRWGYGKLRRKNTEFVRLNQEFMPYEQGISIDLMPFDNVPDCLPLRKAHFMLCFIIRKLLWSEVGAKSEENRWIKIIYRIMSLVPFSVIVGMYNQLIEINQHKKTELVRILTFPTPKAVYGYKREWYTKLRRYQFGNMKQPGAKDYDAYLKVKYGDYMKMPPTDKRKVHEISRLSLGREMW